MAVGDESQSDSENLQNSWGRTCGQSETKFGARAKKNSERNKQVWTRLVTLPHIVYEKIIKNNEKLFFHKMSTNIWSTEYKV